MLKYSKCWAYQLSGISPWGFGDSWNVIIMHRCLKCLAYDVSNIIISLKCSESCHHEVYEVLGISSWGFRDGWDVITRLRCLECQAYVWNVILRTYLMFAMPSWRFWDNWNVIIRFRCSKFQAYEVFEMSSWGIVVCNPVIRLMGRLECHHLADLFAMSSLGLLIQNPINQAYEMFRMELSGLWDVWNVMTRFMRICTSWGFWGWVTCHQA